MWFKFRSICLAWLTSENYCLCQADGISWKVVASDGGPKHFFFVTIPRIPSFYVWVFGAPTNFQQNQTSRKSWQNAPASDCGQGAVRHHSEQFLGQLVKYDAFRKWVWWPKFTLWEDLWLWKTNAIEKPSAEVNENHWEWNWFWPGDKWSPEGQTQGQIECQSQEAQEQLQNGSEQVGTSIKPRK